MSPDSYTLFTNARIITTDSLIEEGWLRVEKGRIHSFDSGRPPKVYSTEKSSQIDCSGCVLLPGFIDLHTHGCLGFDFNHASVQEIQQMKSFYAAHGVTSFLATLYTDSREVLSAAMQTISTAIIDPNLSSILGVHLEGPWLNPKYCGAQNPALIRCMEKSEALHYLESGIIRLVTIAPEIENNQWLIHECHQRGITLSAGHTDASFSEMQLAVADGITQITHTFNAMRPFHHRDPGVVTAALSLPDLKCELIADNVHVHPAVMKLLHQNKCKEGILLITDSISAAGMPDGTYTLEGQKVLCSNGEARLKNGTLAGSTLTMEKALANFIKAVDQPVENIWQCSSYNAASSIKISNRKGTIKQNFDADLVLLDSNLQILLTMLNGRIVYER